MSSTSDSKRVTRASQKLVAQLEVIDLTSSPSLEPSLTKIDNVPPFEFISSSQTSSSRLPLAIIRYPSSSDLPHISPSSLQLLRQKQKKLQSTKGTTLQSLPTPKQSRGSTASSSRDESLVSPLKTALISTLIFADEAAGTAVVIHPDGWVLTCGHCFAESREEWDEILQQDKLKRKASIKKAKKTKDATSAGRPSDQQDDLKRKWLLFYDGRAVCVECIRLDFHRDLALCRIIGLEGDSAPSLDTSPGDVKFAALPLASSLTKVRHEIHCIGQPGPIDLESTKPNQKTNYPLISVSGGRYRGLVEGQDPNDNEEIGCLKHDAWTYWGHSGAPLISTHEDGAAKLVGLHSSWDDATAMRHGVPLEAILEFLKECSESTGVKL